MQFLTVFSPDEKSKHPRFDKRCCPNLVYSRLEKERLASLNTRVANTPNRAAGYSSREQYIRL